MGDPLNKPARRRVVVLAEISGDTWDDVRAELMQLATEIAMHKCLPASSVSGGYSTSHIVVSSERADISHDTWAKELEVVLEGYRLKEAEHGR